MNSTEKCSVRSAECRTDRDVRESEKVLQPVIAVVGPTGTGKTALAIRLAEKLNGEIISGDSMQVYRKMDIGTAKATRKEQEAAVHHLIDIQDYREPYNVKIFQEKCREAIADISGRGKLPILCGGTGLYIKAALYDYQFDDEEEDRALSEQLAALTNEQLWDFLKEKDPKALEKIHINNRKRLLRAAYMASQPVRKTDREDRQQHKPVYDVYFLGLRADKDLVDARIEERVDRMFDQGLAEEAVSLFSDPKSWEFTSFQGIGYKEFKDYFTGESSLEEVRKQIVIHSRQYAKRQMTWFRHQMEVHWFDLKDTDTAVKEAEKWIRTKNRPQ